MDKTFRKFIKYNICKQSFNDDLINLYPGKLNNYNVFIHIITRLRKSNYDVYRNYIRYISTNITNNNTISICLSKLILSGNFKINDKIYTIGCEIVCTTHMIYSSTKCFYIHIKYGINLHQRNVRKNTIMIAISRNTLSIWHNFRLHKAFVFILQSLI